MACGVKYILVFENDLGVQELKGKLVRREALYAIIYFHRDDNIATVKMVEGSRRGIVS